ncbi:MAG: hypothetical protein HY819_23915 [Acidobacteria bacterium]|nr:hypothetical protein [Acidobacteriota bacterium]
MSTDQFDELENFEEIDISELLQIHLAMQAELGVISELLADVLRSGQMNKAEIMRSLHSIGDLSIEAMDILVNEEESDEPFQGSNNGNSSPDVN